MWYKRHYLVSLHGVSTTLLKFQPSYLVMSPRLGSILRLTGSQSQCDFGLPSILHQSHQSLLHCHQEGITVAPHRLRQHTHRRQLTLPASQTRRCSKGRTSGCRKEARRLLDRYKEDSDKTVLSGASTQQHHYTRLTAMKGVFAGIIRACSQLVCDTHSKRNKHLLLCFQVVVSASIDIPHW